MSSSSSASTSCSTSSTSSPLPRPILSTPAKSQPSNPRYCTQAPRPAEHLRKLLRQAGLPDSGTQKELHTRVASLDRIVCFDDDIIQTSAKKTLEEYLSDLGMLPSTIGSSSTKKITKKQLQATLRKYLDIRARNCQLPATLLRRGDFWRVSVRRKNTPRTPPTRAQTAPRVSRPVYIVSAAWGKLGRKRTGQRPTPKKILPTPTKTKSWQKEFKTLEEAMRCARNRIQAKRSEGYYLSTEGSIGVDGNHQNTPVVVREDSERSLKFAGLLRVREFNNRFPVTRFSDLNRSTPTNFESDNEENH